MPPVPPPFELELHAEAKTNNSPTTTNDPCERMRGWSATAVPCRREAADRRGVALKHASSPDNSDTVLEFSLRAKPAHSVTVAFEIFLLSQRQSPLSNAI